MSIIYFITTQDIDTFQKKLQETLFNAVTMPFPLLFDKRYAALINTAYLKLTLPAECLTPEFYRYLRELSLQWQFDFLLSRSHCLLTVLSRLIWTRHLLRKKAWMKLPASLACRRKSPPLPNRRWRASLILTPVLPDVSEC